MNNKQYGLCLCCGTPWMPTIETLLHKKQLISIALLKFERMILNDKQIKELMKKGKQFHFCQPKHIAHVLHKSHHLQAVQYMIDNINTKVNLLYVPFIKTPTSIKTKMYLANWKALPKDEGINLQSLVDLFENLPIAHTRPNDFSMEYELTIDTCKDCNLCMTMRFWFRYHLYTSMSINPNRIIKGSPITIYNVDTHGHDTVDEAENWTQKNALAAKFPSTEFNAKRDFYTAYLAYYLYMCSPKNMKKPRYMSAAIFLLTKKLFMRLSWIVLQVTCLACEYTLGASKKGELNQSPKCLLGAIELYMSYFAWLLSCYQYTALQSRMSFQQWHQYYTGDMMGCESFRRLNVVLIAKEIIPVSCDVASNLLVTKICNNMVQCYVNHFWVITKILNQADADVPKQVREHYMCYDDIPIIEHNTFYAVHSNIDNVIQALGIQTVWDRIMCLCMDYPQEILLEMNRFKEEIMDREVKNIMDRKNVNETTALAIYKNSITNVYDTSVRKGRWASIIDLHIARALGS